MILKYCEKLYIALYSNSNCILFFSGAYFIDNYVKLHISDKKCVSFLTKKIIWISKSKFSHIVLTAKIKQWDASGLKTSINHIYFFGANVSLQNIKKTNSKLVGECITKQDFSDVIVVSSDCTWQAWKQYVHKRLFY